MFPITSHADKIFFSNNLINRFFFRLAISIILSFETCTIEILAMSTSKFVIVETEYGPVKGTRKSTILGMDYINFQGIPYMAAPVGKLRFRDAQPPQKWTEPLDASRELSYPALNMFTMEPEGEEDAGIVNVFTKNTESIRKLPVMVWVK